MSFDNPVSERDRLESLDVLRGFALLGILLLNIIGFGLLSAAYNNPGFDLAEGSILNIATYSLVNVLAEGAMRGLFSILFGAGVILFATGERGKSGWIHYKRTFWLLIFGLINAYVLLWNGDILVTYALAGGLLFLFRHRSPRALVIGAGIVFLAMSLMHAAMNYGLSQARVAAEHLATADEPATLPREVHQGATAWYEFVDQQDLNDIEALAELKARQGDYMSVFVWNAGKNNEIYTMVLPVFLFWDALAMMLLGMGLYKYQVLQGARSIIFYKRLMIVGFLLGLSVNCVEIIEVIESRFDVLTSLGQMQWTYHLGRLGMSLGYIGLILWCLKAGHFSSLRIRLAAVGRMALTNYLLQSLICGLIFSGVGVGLIGSLERFELYPIVLAIWILQLWVSPLWLERYQFGPVEWLWRCLTYGQMPSLRR